MASDLIAMAIFLMVLFWEITGARDVRDGMITSTNRGESHHPWDHVLPPLRQAANRPCNPPVLFLSIPSKQSISSGSIPVQFLSDPSRSPRML